MKESTLTQQKEKEMEASVNIPEIDISIDISGNSITLDSMKK